MIFLAGLPHRGEKNSCLPRPVKLPPHQSCTINEGLKDVEGSSLGDSDGLIDVDGFTNTDGTALAR
jgi:hypothetical protein